MRHLLRAELSHYWAPAAVAALVHLAVLRLLASGDLFTPSAPVLAVGALAYALLGLVFGLIQVGSRRALNPWSYLIHRPLPPWKIGLALIIAGGLLLAAVVAAPLAAITAYVDFLTPQHLDARHYLMIPYALGISLSFYLMACTAALSPTPFSLLLIVMGSIFLGRSGSAPWLLGGLGVSLLWLFALALLHVRPNLGDAPKGAPASVLLALPLQLGFFFVLSGALMLVYSVGASIHSSGLRSFADHAWDTYFPAGTAEHLSYLNGRDTLSHGIRALPEEARAHLARQLTLADVHESSPLIRDAQRRHQPMMLDRRLSLTDPDAGVQWTFRHDEMAYEGLKLRSGESVGWLSLPEGSAPFREIPEAMGGRFVVAGSRIFEWARRDDRLTSRMSLPQGERFTAAIEGEGQIAFTLSDRALYLLDPQALRRGVGLLTPTFTLPIPGEATHLTRLALAPLLDGYLISFVYDTETDRGFTPARQITLSLGLDGAVMPLADEALAAGPPDWVRYRLTLISPGLQLGYDLFRSLSERAPIPPEAVLSRPLPAPIRGARIALCAIAALLVFWGGRRRGLSRVPRILWTVNALVFGIPALLTFACLQPLPEAAPKGAPAPRDPRGNLVLAR